MELPSKSAYYAHFYAFPIPIMLKHSKLNYYTKLKLLHKLQNFYMPKSIQTWVPVIIPSINAYNFTIKSVITSGILLIYYFTVEIDVVNESNRNFIVASLCA